MFKGKKSISLFHILRLFSPKPVKIVFSNYRFETHHTCVYNTAHLDSVTLLFLSVSQIDRLLLTHTDKHILSVFLGHTQISALLLCSVRPDWYLVCRLELPKEIC